MSGLGQLLKRSRRERPTRAMALANEIETNETPLEVMARLDAGGAERAAIRSEEFCEYFEAQDQIEPFERTVFGEFVTLYAAPGASAQSLLLVFSGRGHRPFVPIPIFLQNIDAAKTDVLLLKDTESLQYRTGVTSYAPDFESLCNRLKSDFTSRYEHVVAMGTSMGGFAAIRSQLAGVAAKGVSMCGRRPQEAFLQGQAPPPAFDPICACLPPKKRPLVFVAAQENPKDRPEAEAAAALTGGVTRFMPGSGHNVLAPKWRRDTLRPFLERMMRPAVNQDRG